MLREGGHSVWQCYPKWKIERRWNNFFMRNDGWEDEIYKELKGEVSVSRISNPAKDALKRYVNFFLQDSNISYIRIYGSSIESYQLPLYVSNRLVLMEMMRQLTFLHEHVWHKKSATTNLPFIVGEY